jgi:hypothetical protein
MSPLPKSIHVAEIEIGGVTLRCHHLDDGQRVIEQASIQELYGLMQDGLPMTGEEVEALARFIRTGEV